MNINNILDVSTAQGGIMASIIAGIILAGLGIGASKQYKKAKNKQKGTNNINIQNSDIRR